MKSLLLLYCFPFFIGYTLADNDGGCEIEGIDKNDFQSAYSITIDDTQINTKVLDTPFTGTLEVVEVLDHSNYSYFTVTTEDNNFVITTTENFADVDKNTPKQSLPASFFVIVDTTLKCPSGTSTLTIRVFINDINTHAPTFHQDKYEFKIPTPIMPRTDFSMYGDAAIIVTDIDFTNQNVDFKIEPDDFSVTTLESADSKDYTAVFAASRVIQMTESTRTYTITATDSGTSPGPLSNTVTVTLILDEANSLESPTFEQTSYGFNYTIEGDKPKLTELDGDIKITTRKASSLTHEITGEFRDYFEISFVASTTTFALSPKQLLPDGVDSFVILTLSATTDNTAVTSLIVNLPSASAETPRFSNPYFTGSYDDVSNTVELDGPIEVTSIRTPSVSISGEYSEHFTAKYDEKDRSIQITVKSKLSIAEIKSKSYATLELEASVGDKYGVATLVLSLPQYTLQFTKGLYTATYKNDALTDLPDIGFTTQSNGVKFELAGPYENYFGIKTGTTKNQYTLFLTKPLSSDILRTEHEIVISVTATDDYEDTAESAISIELPRAVADSPAFSQVYYLADYTNTGTPTVAINKDITITNRDDLTKIKVTMDSYTTNFAIDYDTEQGKWVFKAIAALSEDTLRTKKELVITLIAEEEGNTKKGEATVVVNWITKEAIQFSQVRYTGTYPKSGTGTIALNPDISFSNVDDVTKVAITLDSYADNFEMSYANKKWAVAIKKKLDDAMLSKSGDLVVTLTAKDSVTNSEDKSVLIIELPTTKVAPEFSESYYIGKYPDSGTGTITLQSEFKIANVEAQSTVSISLGSYSENFAIAFNSGKWTVTLQQPLDKAILSKSEELVIALTATEIDNINKGHSVLVIDLPGDKSFKFSEAYYLGDYPRTGTSSIDLGNPIAFSNIDNPEKVKISLDKYADNFEIRYDNQKWILNIKSALSDTVLDGNEELLITMTATDPDSNAQALATLVLQLPDKTPPQFSQVYYLGDYPGSGAGNIAIDNPIEFLNVDNPTDVTISLDKYANNFRIHYESNKWTLSIQSPLGTDVLNTNTELVITLIATEVGNKHNGEAVLVLDLPTSTDVTELKFLDTFYIVQYPETGSGVIQFNKPVGFSNIYDPLSIKITLDNYSDNFEIAYVGNAWQINIKIPLDKSVLNKNAELVATLIATETGQDAEGKASLVIELPTSNEQTAPDFADSYYIAQYPEEKVDVIEFIKPITFINVDDLTKVTINLDQYDENFEISYESNKWHLKVKKSLSNAILYHNAEIVMSLIAQEEGNENKGYSALVLKLPTATKAIAPIFSEAYYTAEYPESGSGTIEFDTAISFANVEDPTKLKINVEKYENNFEITYEKNIWHINIKQSLSETVLHNNVEIVMTLVATEDGVEGEGLSAVILKLPSSIIGTAPKFLDAYYIGDYPDDATTTIDFETPIQFVNIAEPSEVSITLDKYGDNFEVLYQSDRWYINIKNSLEEAVLHDNVELVMTMIATSSETKEVGDAALVLKLPTSQVGTAPIFSEAYYLAKYPKINDGTIEFEKAIAFKNVEDITTIKIATDSYTENFDITYDSNRWYIKIKKELEEAVLRKNVELVITLVATETGNDDKGRAALVLELPSYDDTKTIEFSEAYYLAQYPINGSDIIDFQTTVKFKNVDDLNSIEITLSQYSSNFDVVYDGKAWYVKILKQLDESVLIKNAELVMTLTAHNKNDDTKGYSVLVLNLPSPAEAPKFSDAYYLAEYPESGTGNIEFKTPLKFSNVDNPTDVQIKLDNYLDNFEIVYDSDRWYIKIAKSLENSVLTKNVELIMTMIATETGHQAEGEATLVLKLPSGSIGPEFSNAYYLADYVENDSGVIEFETPITFLNGEDATNIKISLDSYVDNFEVRYEANRWYLKVNTKLQKKVLNENAELVITLTAVETGKTNEGYAALVLKLPAAAKATAPEFEKAYYTAKYPENGEKSIQFENAIQFLNVDDPKTVKITVDSYSENFDMIYESNKWSINVKKNLDGDTLAKNAELVLTLIATETGNQNQGYSALVLRLPTAPSTTGITFSKIYYTAAYPDTGKGTVDINDAIEFFNVDDIKTVTITVDTYQENFKITYESNKWVLNILKNLDSDVFVKNTELVITLVATNSADNTVDRSVLVVELPEETGPIFSDAYYTAEYTKDVNDIIVVENDITFKNVDDAKTVSIVLDQYSENFDIKLVSNKWYIQVKKLLDDSIINENSELIATMVATETNKQVEGYAALVIKLPAASNDAAPEFSKSYYEASYKNDGSKPTIELSDAINIKNRDDQSKIKITVDNYEEYISVVYDESKKTWNVNVLKNIPDEILDSKTDLIVSLTATDTTNNLSGYSAIDLSLPSLDTRIPKFSKAYYTGKYEFSNNAPIVTLDTPLVITNKDSVKDVTITLDNYGDNFKIEYIDASKKWTVQVTTNLEEPTLNSKTELLITLTATGASVNDVGQSVLALTLPAVNTDEAPKFSSIFYSGKYKSDNGGSITLDDSIQIVNKNDLTKVKVNVDDTYKNNFEINLDAATSKWVLKVKTPLDDSVLKTSVELKLTLTATEVDNADIGQAVIILDLPLDQEDLPPKFSLPHYTATYSVKDDKASISLDDTITVVNKARLTDISVTLDSYQKNFKVSFDSSKKQWTLDVDESLPKDVLESQRELILTLIAIEDGNENDGESTLIVTLPSSSPNEETLKFSQVHYAAEYVNGKNDEVKLGDIIKVDTKADTKNLVISFKDEEYADHFQIVLESDVYVVKVLKPLPSTVLGTKVSLPLTLVATLDGAEAYSTLVINLPPATTDHSISFSEPLYEAIYSVSDEGTVNFEVQGSIKVNTDADDSDVEPSITSTTGYEEYFGFSYSKNVFTVVKTKNIPDSVLKIKSFIPLIITVGLRGTEDAVSAVLNVAIDFSGNGEQSLIQFSKVLYNGIYDVVDGKGTFKVDDVIAVQTSELDSDVEATVANEYFAYFRAVYSKKIVTLNLLQQIPTEILQSISVIPVILELQVKGSDNPALAVLNIDIIYNSENDPGLIQFPAILYTAHYSEIDGKGQLSVDQDIPIITDAEDSQVKPSIEDSDYSKYFTVTYASHSISVKLASDIPEDVLNNISNIPLVLTAEITGTTHRHSTVLDVIIAKDNEDIKSLQFTKPLYKGEYDVTDGKVTVTIDDPITLATNEDDGDIEVIVGNEYDDYFAVTYSNKIVTITSTQVFSTEFLNKNSIISILLQADVKGSNHKDSTVLNLAITLDHNKDTALLEFATFLYTGKLTVSNGKEELTLNEEIKVNTDAKDTEIIASISKRDNDLSEYFSTTYSNKKISVKLLKDIPENILAITPSISLSLLVNIIGSTQSAHAVLTIPVYSDEGEKESVKFSDSLYNGKYTVIDGTGVLTIDDDINIITDESDDNNIEVIVSNEYDGYIEVSYSNKVVNIGLKKQLSTEILTGITFISIKLQASVKDNTYKAAAVLNIVIVYQPEDPILVEFSSLRYTGQYSVKDGKQELEVADIKVITDADDSKIKPTIYDVSGSDFSKYFAAIYTSKSIAIKLTADIPEDIVKVTRIISLIINAEIIGSTYRASAVLDIIINDADEETKSVDFSELLYHGKYKVTGGNGVLTLDDKIQIDTNEDDSKVQVIVSNEYDGYFSAIYSDKIVTVSLKKQLSSEILNTTVVPVTLKASIAGTPYEAFAVLNIIIFYDGEPDSNSVLEFSTILYYGNYSVVDNTGKLQLKDDIKLITDKGDDDIEIGLSEDSSYKNLNITYSDHIVSIALNENLPNNIVTSNKLLALTLVANIKGTTQRSSAVLDIEIDSNNNDDDGNKNCKTDDETAYIAVISLLSILLILLIAAVVAFYFLRIRKRSYSNLEEEDGRLRFNKHSHSTETKPSSSLEERRPTGFIFNPISEDSADGTDSIGEPEKTRRKSVAFDDNVEKLQLEPSLEEDNVSEDDTKDDTNTNTTNPDITHV